MFKHQKASFITALAATACVLISLVFFLISGSTVGYSITNGHWGLIATAVSVLFGAASLLAQSKKAGELAVSLMRLAALFLVMAALAVLLMDRAVVAGGLFTWNSLDKYAWQAFYTGIACLVFQLLGAILFVASGCMKQGSAE